LIFRKEEVYGRRDRLSAKESAMDIALQLFGYLILTVLAIVVPIFIVLLSIFQEGVSKLSEQYENQKSQSEKNLKKQWAKQTRLKKSDKVEEIKEKIKKIKQVIKKIESDKKTAKTKLVYLDLRKQMARLFILLMISFSGIVLATLIKDDISFTILISLVSLVSVVPFILAVIILWKLLGIIIEVKKIIDDEKRETETKTVDALLALQDKLKGEKKETPLFLKDVYLKIEGKSIKEEEEEFEFPVNSKRELEVIFHNDEEVMVKNLEAGIVLPSDFVVEKSNRYRITTDTNGNQTIRYEMDKTHGRTNVRFLPLIFTAIAEGKYDIRTFIKAENIKPIYRIIKFKIK